MASLYHLTASNTVTLDRPHYRTAPRISLLTGVLAGRTISVAHGVPAATTIDLACDLVQDTGLLVSVAAPGPLPALPGLVATALARTAITADRLELTVAAPAIEEAGIEALLALSALRDLGIGIALRGFGRGRIAIVPRLPVNSLILSSSVIRDIPGDAAATMLVHTLLGLARSESLPVVATGIETEAQRALLSGIGCTDGEGGLFDTAAMARHRP